MFAKIFTQIYDSSIREDSETRFTFMDMLILADINGVVDMTHESIAARTNRPIEVIRRTINVLESPDPRSRTPDNEGRRIVRLDEHRDWGWLIANYERFRMTASDDQRRERTRERTRKYRENISKTKKLPACDAPVTHGDAEKRMSRHAEAEAEAEADVKEKKKVASLPAFDDFELHVELNNDAFKEAWGKWHEHLKQKKKPTTQHARELQLSKLSKMGSKKAIETLYHCIEHNWQGLYPIQEIKAKGQKQPESSTSVGGRF